MEEELKVGDRVRVRYWKELPSTTEWNREYFKVNGGAEAKITGFIKDRAILDVKLWISEKSKISINALKKLEYIPEELFEIE